MSITNNGAHIAGSPTSIFVSNAPVDPTASFAYGPGLMTGIAGQQAELFIQAKDTRQTEIQNTGYVLQIQTLPLSHLPGVATVDANLIMVTRTASEITVPNQFFGQSDLSLAFTFRRVYSREAIPHIAILRSALLTILT